MKYMLVFVLTAGVGLARPGVAQETRCGAAAIVAPDVEVNRWAQGRKIYVGSDLRQDIVRQYCTSAAELIAERADPSYPHAGLVSDAAINRVRSAVINDYLDNYSDPGRVARTMRAALSSQLGVQGFSRPVQRAYGLVRVTYRSPVDRIKLRDTDYDPWPRFFLKPGVAEYVGSTAGHRVCQGHVTVNVATQVQVTC